MVGHDSHLRAAAVGGDHILGGALTWASGAVPRLQLSPHRWTPCLDRGLWDVDQISRSFMLKLLNLYKVFCASVAQKYGPRGRGLGTRFSFRLSIQKLAPGPGQQKPRTPPTVASHAAGRIGGGRRPEAHAAAAGELLTIDLDDWDVQPAPELPPAPLAFECGGVGHMPTDATALASLLSAASPGMDWTVFANGAASTVADPPAPPCRARSCCCSRSAALCWSDLGQAGPTWESERSSLRSARASTVKARGERGTCRSMANGEMVGSRSILRRAWSRPQRGGGARVRAMAKKVARTHARIKGGPSQYCTVP